MVNGHPIKYQSHLTTVRQTYNLIYTLILYVNRWSGVEPVSCNGQQRPVIGSCAIHISLHACNKIVLFSLAHCAKKCMDPPNLILQTHCAKIILNIRCICSKRHRLVFANIRNCSRTRRRPFKIANIPIFLQQWERIDCYTSLQAYKIVARAVNFYYLLRWGCCVCVTVLLLCCCRGNSWRITEGPGSDGRGGGGVCRPPEPQPPVQGIL